MVEFRKAERITLSQMDLFFPTLAEKKRPGRPKAPRPIARRPLNGEPHWGELLLAYVRRQDCGPRRAMEESNG